MVNLCPLTHTKNHTLFKINVISVLFAINNTQINKTNAHRGQKIREFRKM